MRCVKEAQSEKRCDDRFYTGLTAEWGGNRRILSFFSTHMAVERSVEQRRVSHCFIVLFFFAYMVDHHVFCQLWITGPLTLWVAVAVTNNYFITTPLSKPLILLKRELNVNNDEMFFVANDLVSSWIRCINKCDNKSLLFGSSSYKP